MSVQSHDSRLRGHINDAPAAALSDHNFACNLAYVKYGVQIDIDYSQIFLRRNIAGRRTGTESGNVAYDVNPLHFFQDRIKRLFHLLIIGQVHCNPERVRRDLFCNPDNFRVPVKRHYFRSFF